MRRALASVVVLGFLAAPALAAGKKESGKPADGPTYDLGAFAAPITYDGRIVNYVFVSVRLQGAPGVELKEAKLKEPFLRDAMVRAAHRTPFGKPGVLTEVDEGRVAAAAMAEARRVIGPKTFVRASVRKQIPKRTSGLPAVRTAAASH